MSVEAVSPVYESAAQTLPGQDPQPDYLNAVVSVATRRDPEELLNLCSRIEQLAGRERRTAWAPRTLDLDILTYEGRSLDTPHLAVPHPRLAERPFVLQPLFDVAPDLSLPAPFNASVYSLLQKVRGMESLRRRDERLWSPEPIQ